MLGIYITVDKNNSGAWNLFSAGGDQTGTSVNKDFTVW